jgi:hypothetical protein
MKFKQILKKAWLPALTVLAICAGAVILNATIRTSEAMQLEQTALNAAEAPEETAATEAPGEGTVETAVATPTIAPEDTTPVSKPSGDYRYIEVASEDGSTPGAQDLSSFEAGRNAVGIMEAAFGDAFTSGSHDIYLTYQKYAAQATGSYIILVGSNKWGEATFSGVIDSISGKVQFINRETPESKLVNKSPDDVDEGLMKAAETDDKLFKAATELIQNNFADSRVITETILSGIQWDFSNPDNDVVADLKFHMSEGECYTVRLAYPSCDVIGMEIYPLGWDACWHSYWNEADAEEASQHA